MYILFWDIFVCYFSCVIIFAFIFIVFMRCILNSWSLDAHSCGFNTHSCVVDVHTCALHVYCCISSNYGNVIIYRVQDCYFFCGSHYRYLIYSVVICCLLFVIIWRIFGSGCGGIFEAAFIGCVVNNIIIIVVVYSCGDVMCIDIIVVYL